MDAPRTEIPEETKEYPPLLLRIKAAFTDIFFIILLMYGLSDLFSLFDEVYETIRVAAFVLIFVLYDPIALSLFGATLGHWYFGIQVKRESDEHNNISFPVALFRYILKTTLGWLSFLTISSNHKKKAVHDHIVGSVVIFA